MYTIFFPAGTDLPTGVVTVMLAGRCSAWLTTCWAAEMLAGEALADALADALPDALPELLDDPQAPSRIANAAVRATAACDATDPAARRCQS